MPLELTWDSFRESFVLPAIPAVHMVDGDLKAQVFVDHDAVRVGLLLPEPKPGSDLPPSGRALFIRRTSLKAGPAIEVSIVVPALFEEFFALAGKIIRRVELGASPSEATATEIDAWKRLLQEQTHLSAEQELGLWGELWVLDWLLERGVRNAPHAWTGPVGEPHDFRLDSREFEVKTSLNVRRHHTISSLEQLVPSLGHSLAIISILVAPQSAPQGQALPDLVARIRDRVAAGESNAFEVALARAGYLDADNDRYKRGLVLRAEPQWIPVDAACPVLTRATLAACSGEAGVRRILGATYRVDLEELGQPISRAPALAV